MRMYDTLFEYIGDGHLGMWGDKWVVTSFGHGLNEKELLYVIQPVIRGMGKYGIGYLHVYVLTEEEMNTNFKEIEGSFNDLNEDVEVINL